MNWRKREAEAAVTLRQCCAAFAERGSTPMLEAVGAGAVEEWQHYPAGDIYDPTSHAQYFFHRHADAAGPALPAPPEYGHFHLFLRGEGMPEGVAPLLLPELAVANAPPPRQSAPLKRGGRDEVCHLAAVSVDAKGEPIRLFTTNRWVTGETWYGADDVVRMLDCFRLPSEHSAPLLSRWVAAMVRLFQPEIAALLRRRDQTIMEWRWRRRANVFEDPRLEVTSSLDIDLEARLGAVEGAVGGRPPAASAARTGAFLPPMAEGWGA